MKKLLTSLDYDDLNNISNIPNKGTNVVKNIADTGANIPDPDDVPGGIFGERDDMLDAANRATTESNIGKSRKKTIKIHGKKVRL